MWMNAVVATSFLFIFLSTAEFIYAKSSTALSPTSAVTLVGSQVTLPTADVNDDKLHRYGVHIDDGKGGNVEVRFLLFKKPDGNIVSVADACQICGPVGFYIGDQGITCKMCASPLNAASMGQKGGCNPIPLKSTISGGQLTIQAADLREPRPGLRTLTMPPRYPSPSASLRVVILSEAKDPRIFLCFASLPFTTSGADFSPITGGRTEMFFRLLMESFRRQRRRKLLAGIAILLGTTAVTAMLALATTIGDRIHKELAVYGANIIVYPKADQLEVKVGGVDIKPASSGTYLKESDLEKLKTIFWANNITGSQPRA